MLSHSAILKLAMYLLSCWKELFQTESNFPTIKICLYDMANK